MANNTKTTGDVSEAFVLARYVELGFTVSQPFGDNARYDLIVDDGSDLHRVQVKTARFRKGCLVFGTTSGGGGFTTAPNRVRQNYVGQADLFAVYAPHTRACYQVPVRDAPSGCEMWLRVVEPLNNKSDSRINWASSYLL